MPSCLQMVSRGGAPLAKRWAADWADATQPTPSGADAHKHHGAAFRHAPVLDRATRLHVEPPAGPHLLVFAGLQARRQIDNLEALARLVDDDEAVGAALPANGVRRFDAPDVFPPRHAAPAGEREVMEAHRRDDEPIVMAVVLLAGRQRVHVNEDVWKAVLAAEDVGVGEIDVGAVESLRALVPANAEGV